ncbi:lysosome membrane protein 2-like isoform X2 [Rhodnius prolixus]|uniref:lysosome membrane protein 2-like isoform X2 n=1 Tax=Rhodnius prolixus TaxID=13249 RepID=UPI003D1882EB
MAAEETKLEPKKFGELAVPGEDSSDQLHLETQPLNQNGERKFEGRSDSKYLGKTLENLHDIFKFQARRSKENKYKSCGIYLTIILLVLSFACTVFMVGTNWFDTTLEKIITLSNGTFIYNLWQDSDVEVVVRVYPFNYTNVEAVLAGMEKPVLKEVGPYVFKQNISKWNINFHGMERITYSENVSTVFLPEESKGTLADVIYTPNVLVIASVNIVKELNMYTQLTFSATLKSFKVQPFWKLSIHECIFGYEEKIKILSDIVTLLDQEIAPTTGLLSNRMGLLPDEITIGTGVPDLAKRGIIQQYNGKETVGAWEGDECNNITSSDGILLPAETVRSGETLYFFRRILCRRFPFTYENYTTTAQGYPVKRYRMLDHIFSYGRNFSHNYCYCRGRVCPPSGIFYPSPCYYDSPIFFSKPHFMDGDGVLLEDVKGLNPDPEKHTSSVDVHDVGVVVGAVLNLQVGVTMHKARFVTPFNRMKDGMALPIGWISIVFKGSSKKRSGSRC